MLYIQSSNEVIKGERKSVQYFALTIKFSFKGNKIILNLVLDLNFYLLFTPSPLFLNLPLGPWNSFCLEGISRSLEDLRINIESGICRWGTKMYTILTIYIKQMTSSECPLGRAFIEVASRVSREGSFDSGKKKKKVIMMKSLEFSQLGRWFPKLSQVNS